MLRPVASSSTSLTTDSRAMLNYVRDKASPCLKPVSTVNSSDNSPLNLTLHLECCTHAFTSPPVLQGFQVESLLSIAYKGLWSHTPV